MDRILTLYFATSLFGVLKIIQAPQTHWFGHEYQSIRIQILGLMAGGPMI